MSTVLRHILRLLASSRKELLTYSHIVWKTEYSHVLKNKKIYYFSRLIAFIKHFLEFPMVRFQALS